MDWELLRIRWIGRSQRSLRIHNSYFCICHSSTRVPPSFLTFRKLTNGPHMNVGCGAGFLSNVRTCSQNIARLMYFLSSFFFSSLHLFIAFCTSLFPALLHFHNSIFPFPHFQHFYHISLDPFRLSVPRTALARTSRRRRRWRR